MPFFRVTGALKWLVDSSSYVEPTSIRETYRNLSKNQPTPTAMILDQHRRLDIILGARNIFHIINVSNLSVVGVKGV